MAARLSGAPRRALRRGPRTPPRSGRRSSAPARRHHGPARAAATICRMTARPFRFIAGPGDALDRHALVERARRAEGLGYGALLACDRLVRQLAAPPAPVPV